MPSFPILNCAVPRAGRVMARNASSSTTLIEAGVRLCRSVLGMPRKKKTYIYFCKSTLSLYEIHRNFRYGAQLAKPETFSENRAVASLISRPSRPGEKHDYWLGKLSFSRFSSFLTLLKTANYGLNKILLKLNCGRKFSHADLQIKTHGVRVWFFKIFEKSGGVGPKFRRKKSCNSVLMFEIIH